MREGAAFRTAAQADAPGAAPSVTRIGPAESIAPCGERRVLPAEPPDGERERLVWSMEQSGWVQAKAARLLRA